MIEVKTSLLNHRLELREAAVVYWSKPDRRWIAHGLRTDQIGAGESPIRALADLMLALDQVVAEAARQNISALRPAPPAIRRLASRGKALPVEVYRIAERIARGDWPADLVVDFEPIRRTTTFTTDLHGAAA